jgi:hypothetical protein
MNSPTRTWLKEHVGGFLLTGVLLLGWLYAITASWQNGQKLDAQTAQLTAIHGDLAGFKKSFISFLLDKDPNKSEIIKGLVSDTRTLQGIDQFKAGQFQAAYAMWLPSAQQGSRDSAFAIAAANAALEQQASDASLPQDQRKEAEAALADAPLVEFHAGSFDVRPRK